MTTGIVKFYINEIFLTHLDIRSFSNINDFYKFFSMTKQMLSKFIDGSDIDIMSDCGELIDNIIMERGV